MPTVGAGRRSGTVGRRGATAAGGALLLAVASLGACGHGTDQSGAVPRHTVPPATAPGQAAAAAVCRWLDPALVRAVVGAAVTSTEPRVDPSNGLRCTYVLGNRVDAVVLVAYPSGGAAIFDATRAAGRVPPQPIADLGAAAAWLADLRLLVVRTATGGAYFVQLATIRPGPDDRGAALRLARSVAARAG